MTTALGPEERTAWNRSTCRSPAKKSNCPKNL
eukprot:CAMPEP_0115217778 /NCGR_PEP_ID=MMETSP0270-20121206/26042_1 /TAXON_ID=71861 /ORGANISM="Scrippsiella trochoidea, Strain CCMP3099" /LENGTH=31 /DNA_ID= /DNA_START= /DNA_END= /DNA_ORIENTATION=